MKNSAEYVKFCRSLRLATISEKKKKKDGGEIKNLAYPFTNLNMSFIQRKERRKRR